MCWVKVTAARKTHTFLFLAGAVQVLRPLLIALAGGGEEPGNSPGWVKRI